MRGTCSAAAGVEVILRTTILVLDDWTLVPFVFVVDRNQAS